MDDAFVVMKTSDQEESHFQLNNIQATMHSITEF